MEEARVVGIGPFSKKLKPFMVSNGDLKNLRKGMLVYIDFFQCFDTKSVNLLCSIFGIDKFDYSTHDLSKNNRPDLLEDLDFQLLNNIQETMEWKINDIEAFVFCYKKKFKLIFSKDI